MYTHVYMHMYIYIYIHMCVYIYIYICSSSRRTAAAAAPLSGGPRQVNLGMFKSIKGNLSSLVQPISALRFWILLRIIVFFYEFVNYRLVVYY